MPDKSPQKFFDTKKIYANYLLVEADFDKINKQINCSRDAFNTAVITNLMLAYDFLNEQLAAGKKRSFLDAEDMIELNTIIHLGRTREDRGPYEGFLKETRDKFKRYVPYLQEWYKRHEKEQDDPYKIAAGIYVRILAAPQLFSDGNHRTGALLANYYLMKKGLPPFILTPENAVEFFNLASDIKFKKSDLSSKFKRAIGWRDEVHAMRYFLKSNTRPFTEKTPQSWAKTHLKPPTHSKGKDVAPKVK